MARRRREHFSYFCASLSISLWKMMQNWENVRPRVPNVYLLASQKVNILPFWNPKGKNVYPKSQKGLKKNTVTDHSFPPGFQNLQLNLQLNLQ